MDAISRLGLDVDTAGLARGAQGAERLARGMDQAEREAAQLENRTRRLGGQLSVMGGLAQNLAAQLGAAFSIYAVIRANDAWVAATNQLRLVTDSARELRDMTQQVFDLSQRTATRFENTSALFASIQRATNLANMDVLRLTETINKLAMAGGGPQGSRDSALFQLRQLFQGVNVQAQEFNSLVDGTPLLVQAIADSLGVTRRELRQMVLDARLTSAAVIDALQEQADEADALFGRVAFTMGDAFVRLQNAFQKLVGTNLGPVFAGLVNAISFVAERLDLLMPLLAGVGAAVAVAFAPTAVLAFGAAVRAVFALIATHPIAALVGAIVAVGAAVVQFKDDIVVAQGEVRELTSEIRDGVRVQEASIRELSITAGDLMVGMWDEAVARIDEWRRDVREATNAAGDDVAEAAERGGAGWRDMLSFIGRGLDGLVNAGRHFAISFGTLFETLWIGIQLGFMRSINAIGNALEERVNGWRNQLPDFAREFVPALRIPDIDTSQVEARGRRVAEAYAAAIQDVWDDHPVTEFIERSMERAAMHAMRRGAEGSSEADPAAAAVAAAEAAARANAQLRKQIEARQALFDTLEAQLTLNEREFAIYEETNQLLRQFPDYYAQMAAGAEDVAAAARDAAEQDARSLDMLRRKVAVLRSLKTLARENADTEERIAAATIGAEELAIVERTQELLREHAELYESMGNSARDVARAEAQRQLRNERILDTLTRQAERAQEIARAPAENLMEGLEAATDDFWTNFSERGFDAFDDLGDALKDVFRRLQADILRAVFDPILAAVRGAIQQGFQGVNQKGGAGGFSLNSIFDIFTGRPGKPGKPGGGFSIPGLGNFNLGGIGQLIGQAAPFIAIAQMASQLGTSILSMFGDFSPSTVRATSIASSLIGGVPGGLLGAIFGKKPSGHAAWADISPTGALGPFQGPKRNDNTTSMLQATFDKAKQAIDFIERLGGASNAYLSRLSISEKHQSGYELRDRVTGQIVDRTSDARIAARDSVGNPDELYNDAISALLKKTTFDNPVLNSVKDAMSGAGKGADEILEVLAKLREVLPDTSEELSQWGQALKQLNETFDDLRASTAGVAGVAAQLDQAFAAAKAALRGQFADTIEDAILAIESPLTLQLEELMKVQAKRLQDAAALGADVSRVMHLNELELQGFIEQAGGSAEAFEALNGIFAELIAKAQAAGQATQPLIDAYNQARTGVVDAFNDSVAQKLADLTNPTLGALKALLDAQKSRLDQARAIGANILAVERLNALEQQAFFESLTDAQRQDLAAHLGLIEDFTGRIAVVLSGLNDELNQRIDDTEAMRNDLLRQSDAMRSLAENLAATRQGIVDRYGALTPMAGVEALRERLSELAEQARGGNDSALNALGQVGQQLIEASRALYGSTSTFRGDYDLVTQILQEAETLAGGRADALASEAETLVQQRDLLIEIRDILSDPDPALDVLAQRLGQLDANQDVVAGLLSQYLQLAAQQAGQSVNFAELVQDATAAAQIPSLQTSTQLSLPSGTPTASNQNGATATTTSSGATSGAGATETAAVTQMLAVQVDVLQDGFDRMTEAVEDQHREIRRLNERLGVGGGRSSAAALA